MPTYQAQIRPLDEFTARMESDFDTILRDEFRSKGYNPDVITEKDELRFAYFSTCSRRVTTKPRTVHTPQNFQVDDSVAAGFDELVRKFENGENVNPHLSRSIDSIDSKDKLFYDWGINHFHLGTQMDGNGFIQRTGPLVFAMVKQNDVYIIKIDNHGTWTNKDLIEIIDSNWPELISHSRVEGMFETDFDSNEIKHLRNANINVGITLPNGHGYISIGGGIQTSGVSSLAVMASNSLLHKFRDYYNALQGKIDLVADEEFVTTNGTMIEIGLKREGNVIYLYTPDFQWQTQVLTFPGLPT